MARNRQFYKDTESGISAAAETGVGNVINCSDFRNAVVSLGTAAASTLTVKFYGAIGNTAPDFSAAQSVANRWHPLDFAPSNAGGVITDGDTGISASNEALFVMASINTDLIDYLCVVVTAYTGGAVTASIGLAGD